MKKRQKKKIKKLFAETKFGKTYLKSLTFVSAPFANMFHYANNKLEHPGRNIALKAYAKIDELIQKYENNETLTEEQSNEVAEIVLKYEDLIELDNDDMQLLKRHWLKLKDLLDSKRPVCSSNHFQLEELQV